ncbi:MAG: GNAT family N-acetyltransferase [Leeuwenhoekiella sp.]
MPKQVVIETERLYLREFTPEDAADLYEISKDKKVLKYTGDEPFESIAAAEDFIKSYSAFVKPGLGRWAILDKESQKFIGWCALKFHPMGRVVDLGYRLKKQYRKQGYATEAAKACLDYAFNTLKLVKLIAHAHVENKASQNVLEKIGFKYLKTFNYEDINAILYSALNPLYEIKTITGQQTWPVRHPVLRQGRPLEDCHFEGDDLPDTIHLGLYYSDSLTGVVSLLIKDYKSFSGVQYQLRGMAVLPEYQQKGLGEFLVLEAEKRMRKKRINTLWFNAREVALSFYSNLGYEKVGDSFEISPVGTHFLMYKKII